MKYSIVLVTLVISIILGGVVLRTLSSKKVENTPVHSSVSLVMPTVVPTKVEELPPSSIRIPKLNVSAAVERIGVDATGRLGVPAGEQNAGWLSTGPKPGEEGSALMDGHYDLTTGAPGVFYSIHTLQPGDIIEVRTVEEKLLTFRVTDLVSYPSETFPFDQVLAPTHKKRLLIITCAGLWDAVRHEYPERLLVTSELIES